MITEEHISKKVNDTYEEMGKYKGNPKKQSSIHKELNTYLQSLYQQDKQQMIDLFWKLFHEGKGYYEEILFAIIAVPDSKAIQLAAEIMLESNEHLREEAAKFLYDVKDPMTVPFLIEGLKSDDYNVVSKSSLALGNIGDSRAEPYLLEIVNEYDNDAVYSEDRIDDAYPIIRYNAFSALCLLNTLGAQKRILQSVLHDQDIGIQLKAIRYLVVEMPAKAKPYLEELSKHENGEISNRAKQYLEELDLSH